LKLGADGDREMEKRSGEIQREPQEPSAEPITSPLALSPENIRLTACKPSRDGKALVVRLHETSGREISAELTIFQPLRVINLEFKPFEIKTVRVERSGAWREVDLIEEV
jgi:alpha-mannosidase